MLLNQVNFVIIDFSVSFTLISFSDEKIFNKHGNKRNVTNKETINPKVIIQPKSIIGFIPLKIKDKKAQIVVKTVYRIGNIIFLLASKTASFLLNLEILFLVEEILLLNEYSLPYLILTLKQ